MAVEFIFMDGTLQLDGTHRGVYYKKCFLPVIQPFWKRPEDVINKVETRSQLQKKKVFFENIKNKYLKYVRTKRIKNLSLLNSYSESENIQTMNLQTTNQVDALKQH